MSRTNFDTLLEAGCHFVIVHFGKIPMTFFHSFLKLFAIADYTGFNHLPQQARATPQMVPPVPTPATKTSTFPSVSVQISSPVVSV